MYSILVCPASDILSVIVHVILLLFTEGLDPAERDAALTMCMISGGENGSPPVTSELLQAILHDHCYSKKPPNFIVPAMPRLRRRRTGYVNHVCVCVSVCRCFTREWGILCTCVCVCLLGKGILTIDVHGLLSKINGVADFQG